MISGNVDFGIDLQAAMTGILSEWASGRDYEDRVDSISGTGSGDRNNDDYFLIAGQTVLDDSSVDTLIGGSGDDWFLYSFFGDLLGSNDPEQDEEETDIG